MLEFLPDVDIFDDKEALSPIELLNALESTSDYLIDFENYVKALPLLTLMEYISIDIVRSDSHMIKSRILKSIALSNLGYFNESLQLILKIIHK